MRSMVMKRLALLALVMVVSCGDGPDTKLPINPNNSSVNNPNNSNTNSNNSNNSNNNNNTNNPIANPPTTFNLVNSTAETVYTFQGFDWIELQDGAGERIIWNDFCLCSCDEDPCAVCDLAPPTAMELPAGETRSLTWDGFIYVLDGGERTCYNRVLAPEMIYKVKMCHFLAFETVDFQDVPAEEFCETQDFTIGTTVEVVIE